MIQHEGEFISTVALTVPPPDRSMYTAAELTCVFQNGPFWGVLSKTSALRYHSVSKVSVMRAALSTKTYETTDPLPPLVWFWYESAPGGNISPQMPPYGHRVGFGCMGGTPSAALLAQTPKLGGTPHTYKTNPMAI